MTAEETRATLQRFYDAPRDGETMASMYASDATFEDEVFAFEEPTGRWIGLTRR
jgi:hypothetical protein